MYSSVTIESHESLNCLLLCLYCDFQGIIFPCFVISLGLTLSKSVNSFKLLSKPLTRKIYFHDDIIYQICSKTSLIMISIESWSPLKFVSIAYFWIISIVALRCSGYLQLSLNSDFVQAWILLALCWKFVMVRIYDNGLGWK